MNGRERSTYGAVQRTLALSFTLLVLALLSLRVEGDRLVAPLCGDLPTLCHAESSPCASCGLTRGVVAGLDLDLDAAKRFHPGSLMLLALLALQVVGRFAAGSWRLFGMRAAIVGAFDFGVHFALVGSLVNASPVMP